jgi:HSP20 family protein
MENKPLKRSRRKGRSLTPYWNSPFDRFFRNDFIDSWNGGETDTVPSVNFREDKKNFIMDVAAPGLKKEDFDIRVDGDLLTVSCSKESEHKEEEQEGYTRREYSYSSFSRTMTLPEKADSKKITAKYTDGILSLTIPKKEGAEQESSQKINVE